MRRDTAQQHQRVLHSVPAQDEEEVDKISTLGATAKMNPKPTRPSAAAALAVSAQGPEQLWELKCPLLRLRRPLEVVVGLPPGGSLAGLP